MRLIRDQSLAFYPHFPRVHLGCEIYRFDQIQVEPFGR